MSRRAARGLHLALILVGVLLYLVFVLPRWWVLTGDIPTGVAIAGRLAAGVPIALAALPVFAILRDGLARTAKVPELALRLRAWSAVLHLIAGGLIVLAAIVEIWLRLSVGGPYLFAVYGAAASIAVLAVLALYLSFVAEKPPAEPKPPKPPKPKKVKKVKANKAEADKKPRGKKKRGATDEPADENAEVETAEVVIDESAVPEDGGSSVTDTDDTDVGESVQVEADTVDVIVVTDEALETEDVVAETTVEAAEATSTGLRNKRPAGKRLRRLSR